MSWWKRRQPKQQDTKPSSVSPAAEKDRIESLDLMEIQSSIVGKNESPTIIDANAADGWSTELYLKRLARSRVIAVEPNQDDLAKAADRLASFGSRVELVQATLGASVNATDSRSSASDTAHFASASAHNGYSDDPLMLSAPDILTSRSIDSVTVDHICAERGIELVDIFRVCIKGLGIEALMGAEGMLARGGIRLLLVRVGFVRRSGELPVFGAVTEYLRRFGYELQGIYESRRDPPIILREAEAIFVAPQMQVRAEMPSAPSIPDETIESVEGRRLPDRFLRNAELREGATIRVQSPDHHSEPASDRRLQTSVEVASVLDAIVDTSAEPYRYSLLCHADDEIRGQFRKDELLIAEISVTVLSGKVGIVWLDRDYKPLEARERYIPVTSMARVLVSAPAEHACHLVFRNVAVDAMSATFKIAGIRTKIVGAAFRRALGNSGAEALYLRAYARERAGDREGAARLFANAATLIPDHAAALEYEAELLDMDGKTSAATAKYEAVRKLRTENPRGMADRCVVLRRRGYFTDQIAAFSSLLHTVNNGTFLYVARGNSFLSEGRPDAALRDYESALELKPNLPEVMALKGEALSMLGCYREALETFDLAVAKRSRDPEALGGRAIAYLAVGKVEAADADWHRQLALLAPVHASARACVALRLADYELALAELEQALRKEPRDPYWQLYHITALRRLGRPIPAVDLKDTKGWPSLLLALHAGRLSGNSLLKKADNDSRRAEALFQLGVLALPRDREEALRLWAEVVDRSSPDMIEHAAARHELARLHS